MSNNDKWLEYERKKKKLQNMNLSSSEYDRELRKLVERLKL